ncbi:MAG: WGR domain-containing protein [Kofleriaceae bacterium]|nr:WGR domain-containing protein [Kofleriaceae bacterium]
MTAARRFEFQDSKSSKFWELTLSANVLTVCYGKIGTNGRSNDKEFDTEEAATAEAEKLIAGKVKKGYLEIARADSESTEFIARDSEWLEENEDYEHLSEFGYETILHAEGDVALSEEAIETLLKTADAIIITGNLSVDGALSVQDNQRLLVTGDVKCKSFWAGEGFFECTELDCSQYMEFACDDNMCSETLDIGTLKALVIVCPYVKVDDLASTVAYEFTCNDVDEEQKGISQLLASQFDLVYSALKAGQPIDDKWIVANKHLACTAGASEVASEPPSSEAIEIGGQHYPLDTKKVIAFSSNVVDLSLLSKLTELEYLDLRDTKVSDLTPIRGLVNLTFINIGDTEVSDLRPLENLVNLETLYVSDHVSDLSPISGLIKFKYLSLVGTQVTDLTPLGNLTKLKELILKPLQPIDLKPLVRLSGLKKLTILGSLKGLDLSPLTELKKLKELTIYDHDFDDELLQKALPKCKFT